MSMIPGTPMPLPANLRFPSNLPRSARMAWHMAATTESRPRLTSVLVVITSSCLPLASMAAIRMLVPPKSTPIANSCFPVMVFGYVPELRLCENYYYLVNSSGFFDVIPAFKGLTGRDPRKSPRDPRALPGISGDNPQSRRGLSPNLCGDHSGISWTGARVYLVRNCYSLVNVEAKRTNCRSVKNRNGHARAPTCGTAHRRTESIRFFTDRQFVRLAST